MSNTPDQMQGAQTTTSDDVPNQIPTPDTQAQPSLFQQMMASAVQPAPTQQSPAPQPPPVNPQSNPTQQPDPRDSHPMVQGASIIRRAGEVLAGGTPYDLVIDPATGESKRVPKELDSKHLLLGALSNILGSVGQVSSNLSARMQGRSPAPIQPLPSQQAQQQRDQMSEEDFNRVQNEKVRKAKVLNANMEAMRAAYAIGKEDDAAKDSVIANHQPDLENWHKAGAVEASNIPSDELMAKGFDKSKYVAIPDGKVPVYNKDGSRATNGDGVPLSQLTYSVVDGTTQAPLTQDKYDQLARYGLMTAKENFKLPEGATISSAQLALLNHKVDLLSQTQKELDEVHDAVGGEKVDLASQIKRNPKLLSAIESFHNDGASTDPVNQLMAMRSSNNPKESRKNKFTVVA